MSEYIKILFTLRGYCHIYIKNAIWRKNAVCRKDKCHFKHQIPPGLIETLKNENLINHGVIEESMEDVDECREFLKTGCCNKFRTCPYFHPEVECEVAIYQI